MQATDAENPARDRKRIERELVRLDALAARKRSRRRGLRALRGSAGALATFGALLKVKVIGTVAGKIAIAALIGLGLAWPALAIGVVALLGIVVGLLSLLSGEGGPHDLSCDGPSGCAGRETRAARLKQLIQSRRAWLAAPSGPAPSLRRDARGRHSVVKRVRKRSR